MATATFTSAPDNTSSATAFQWMNSISTQLASIGMVQQSDTGQIVWPGTIVSITNAVAAASVVTFTYTVQKGAALRIGNSITVTNCTTAGLNTTYTITGLPTGNTFTAATGTTVTEAETAFGGVNVQVSITNAIGNGSTNTYTYTALDGILKAGQSVVITGCSTSGFNGTFTIGSIGVGTFTTKTGISHASEVETGTGIVTAISLNTTRTTTTLPPTASSTANYEVWGFNDALQSTLPIIFLLTYSTGGSGSSSPTLQINLGTATNGAGVFVGTSSTNIFVLGNAGGFANNTASSFVSYVSGSSSRILMALWPANVTNFGGRALFSIERSHDSSGNDTSSYFTYFIMCGPNAATANPPIISQASLTASATTGGEGKPTCIVNNSTATGSFGVNTLLSPVFPVVGAVGNPLTNIMVGKAVDWTDLTNFAFTMYNTSRTYQVWNNTFTATAGYLTYSATPTCCLIYRFD